MWELQRAAGRPSIRTLAHESARVASACRKKGFRDARQLTPTTIYDTLNGKRKGPPRWAWLSVYVLTCREIARRSPGLHDEMSDEEALAEWRGRLDAVHDAMRDAGDPPEATPERPAWASPLDSAAAERLGEDARRRTDDPSSTPPQGLPVLG